MRSISGSVDATTAGGGTASTASPLNTPGDGPLDDPLILASKRAMTASPSAFGRASTGLNVDEGDKQAFESDEQGISSTASAIRRRNAKGLDQRAATEMERNVNPGRATPARSWTSNTITNTANAVEARQAHDQPARSQSTRWKDGQGLSMPVQAIDRQGVSDVHSSDLSSSGRLCDGRGAE